MKILGHEVTEEMLKKSGLSKSGLRHRLKIGMTLEQALINTKSTTERINGLDVPKEDVEKAKALGISKQTIRSRLIKGMTLEEALTTRLHANAKGMNAGGKRVSLEQLKTAEKNGVKEKTIRQRIASGWSVERAISEPTNKTNKRNKFPKELLDIAEKNGIGRRIFNRRVHSGWSLEEAATTPYSRSRDGLTETEEMLAWLGRMKYLNRTEDAMFHPESLMKKLNVTWDDIKEVKC